MSAKWNGVDGIYIHLTRWVTFGYELCRVFHLFRCTFLNEVLMNSLHRVVIHLSGRKLSGVSGRESGHPLHDKHLPSDSVFIREQIRNGITELYRLEILLPVDTVRPMRVQYRNRRTADIHNRNHLETRVGWLTGRIDHLQRYCLSFMYLKVMN